MSIVVMPPLGVFLGLTIPLVSTFLEAGALDCDPEDWVAPVEDGVVWVVGARLLALVVEAAVFAADVPPDEDAAFDCVLFRFEDARVLALVDEAGVFADDVPPDEDSGVDCVLFL